MQISEDEYISTRLDNQIDWYDNKSISCQTIYKRYKWAELAAAALIPILSAQVSSIAWVATVIGVLGAVIIVIEGLINLGKYHENWIEYRSVCETLRQEKYMYLTRTGIYNAGDETFNLLVERTESVISKENVNWANLQSNKKGEEKT